MPEGPLRPKTSEGFVYFVQAEGGGPIKIGFTGGSMKDRLVQLQNGNPRRLVCIGIVRGTRIHEGLFHTMFQMDRLVGEWFEPSPELLSVIEPYREAASGGLVLSLDWPDENGADGRLSKRRWALEYARSAGLPPQPFQTRDRALIPPDPEELAA